MPRPSRSSTPVRKFSTSTSARSTRPTRTALSASSLRSSAIDSLLRLVQRKYVDWRASGSPTNGGPQPRVSSPLPGASTLITRAPRSPSIWVACGPARARVRSTTRRSERGPVMRGSPSGEDEGCPDEQRADEGHDRGVAEDLLVVGVLVDRVRLVGQHQRTVGAERADVDDGRADRERRDEEAGGQAALGD